MLMNREYPILEFDEDRNAFIRPENLITPIDGISERAVLCFFADAIEKVLSEYPHEVVTNLVGEGIKIPVYELDYNGEKVVLVQAMVGAPWAAGHLEELTAYGCKKYIACGGCGVLQKQIAVGQLIIPESAVRDEGTSYHYAPPEREINMALHAVKTIESVLKGKHAPYIKAKTWTTDAIFRETPEKVNMRKDEGCVSVEMEASAFMAVAAYLDVDFGQILYAGDSLAGTEWDGRRWNDRAVIREGVLKLAIEACLKL